jgi:N-acetylglutamate synthase-like GNAT family acetyltransferase
LFHHLQLWLRLVYLVEFIIKPASEEDLKDIRSLVRKARINPTGLDWRRFLVAVTASGEVIGCGQIKPHGRDIREIASIAVKPDYQRKGVARAMITQLIAGNPSPLYLMCRSGLEDFYKKFGFFALATQEMPTYYRRIATFVGMMSGFQSGRDTLLVMRRD